MESSKNIPPCTCKRERVPPLVLPLLILEIKKVVFIFQTLAGNEEDGFEESAWKSEFENSKIEISDDRFGRAT